MAVREGFIYLLEFSDGTLKIGRTKHPLTRFEEHRRSAACFGIETSRRVYYNVGCSSIHYEKQATSLLISLGGSCRQLEWFTGIDFELANEGIKKLLENSPPEPCSHRELIYRCGGPTKVAKYLNISRDTVRKWSYIPERHMKALEKLEKRLC